MKFGRHETKPREKGPQSPIAVFTRGLQTRGHQWELRFANGYGASVINDGYGADQGLYELAVLGPNGGISYDTPITDDVLGFLTPDEVGATLDQIEALPSEVSR